VDDSGSVPGAYTGPSPRLRDQVLGPAAAYDVDMTTPEHSETVQGHRGCDFCGGPLPATGGYGTGSVRDGLYCSLDCLARVVYESGEPRGKRVGPPDDPSHN